MKNAIKNIAKVYFGLSAISVAASSVLYAMLNYSEKRTIAKVKTIFESIKDDITKDLELSQTPTIEFDGGSHDGCLMYVVGYEQYNASLRGKTIVGQHTDYVLHVNPKAVAQHITMLNLKVVNDISDDVIKALLRHECRHMHQYQTGFDVGKTKAYFTLNFDGYGTDEKETDANVYAINASENRKERIAAELSKDLQDNVNSIVPDYSKTRACLRELSPIATFFSRHK